LVTQKFLQVGLRGRWGSRERGPADNSGEVLPTPSPGSLALRSVLYVEEVLGRLFLHLQGGVLDAVALSEEQLQVAADQVAVGVGGDYYVGGDGSEAGGYGPDVEVVD
jgi:hypothetical protein